jgi:hypothetical protein
MTKRTAERETFLADIVTTAVEGGMNYWAQTSGYRWYSLSLPDGGGSADPSPAGGGNAYAKVHEFGDEPKVIKVHDLTIETVAKGIGILKKPETEISPYLRRTLLGADTENDAGEVDAEGADVLVQLGLFGEIVYG